MRRFSKSAIMQRLQPLFCKIVSLGQKLKFKKTCEKLFFNHIRVVLCEKPLEKTPNIRQMRRFSKSAIMQRLQPLICKIVSLGQKLKFKKTCEKVFFNHIRVVLCEKPLEKTPNIRQMRPFSKSAIMQRLQPLICKIVSLDQKLKFKKTCVKLFFNHIRVVLCEKPLEKTRNIQQMRRLSKLAIMQRLQPLICKIVSLGQKLKFKKTCEKVFFNHIRVVLCEKPLEKTPNIGQMRPFSKSVIMQRLQPLICKIVSLGQKLKFKKTCIKLFFNHIRVVLCEKPLEKTRNIQQMRRLSKLAIMQRLQPLICKIVSLGQKLKFKKTCEKVFFNHIRVVLCEKPLEKTPNIRQMRRF